VEKSLKTFARDAVVKTPLARWALRYFEWKNARGLETPPKTDAAGLAIPDAVLISTVVGKVDWRRFLASGEKDLRIFAEAVDRNGGNFATASRVLDFGCGCGRLARHASKFTSAEFYGVDYNRRLIDWCRGNLPGHYSQNELRPPLSFESGDFDVVYLLSVFTHLREPTQREWLKELQRVVAPGGHCVITFHDEDYSQLSHAGIDRAALLKDGWAIRNDNVEGSNLLSTFQSREVTRQLFSEFFEVCEIVSSAQNSGQAYAVLRRRP
jgi:SAM-dependent methyltransferase